MGIKVGLQVSGRGRGREEKLEVILVAGSKDLGVE